MSPKRSIQSANTTVKGKGKKVRVESEDDETYSGDTDIRSPEVELRTPVSYADDPECLQDPRDHVVDTEVMQPRFQDDLLEGAYEGLPHLERLFHIEPHGYDRRNSDGQICHALITPIAELMSEENVASLFAGLLFVQHGFYINPSRIDPALLEKKDQRLALIGGGSFCTLITCGVVTTSHLNQTDVEAGSVSHYKQHRVTTALFHQDGYRAVSLIATVLGYRSNPKGTFSSLGLSFITKAKGRGTTFNNRNGYGMPSPKKPAMTSNKGLFTYTEAPKVTSDPVMNMWSYVLNYEEVGELFLRSYSVFVRADCVSTLKVPIFDGRSEVMDDGEFAHCVLQHLANRLCEEELASNPGVRDEQYELFRSQMVRENIPAVFHTKMLDARFKILMTYRLLDVYMIANGAPVRDPVVRGPLLETRKAPLAPLNDLPVLLTRSQKGLTSYLLKAADSALPLDERPTPSIQSASHLIRLYASLANKVSERNVYNTLINLMSASLHIACLLKVWIVLVLRCVPLKD
ncbi:hypothetical protein C0992_011797 [Termitomyces sp. T32_za158]|nr:hypothetical protein C0992_011797 [Termitomyces sp. T32_za158]